MNKFESGGFRLLIFLLPFRKKRGVNAVESPRFQLYSGVLSRYPDHPPFTIPLIHRPNMKPLYKALLFLGILTILDLILRKGLLAFFIPVELPFNGIVLILYLVFAMVALWLSKRFGQSDQMSLESMGISMNTRNRLDFFYGLLVGIVLWGMVSVVQSYTADFSWELRPEVTIESVLYGFLFIFIADLGTELFTRGYPLKILETRFVPYAAIALMVFFVACKSISFEAEVSLLFYMILIPAIHTIFFSLIYLKTRRLGGAVGLHTGANFITISIFDLRDAEPMQVIPSGIFQAHFEVGEPSMHALQLPWVIMAILVSIVAFIWWKNDQ